MNEENSTVVETEAPPKKKHSLWWLKLLLILCVFAGGTIFGLKLPTMDFPEQIREILFPAMQTAAPVPGMLPAQDTAAPAEPAPGESTEPTALPKESAKPTAAPKESAKPVIAPKESTAPSVTPAAEAKPEVSPAAGSAIPAPEKTEAAPGENGYIGIDAALEKALAHAKVKESDAFVYGVYKEKLDDINVYFVDFSVGEKSYEYFINAESGEVESWRASRETGSAFAAAIAPNPVTSPSPAASNVPGVISPDEAKAKALEHAGVKETAAYELEVSLELEGIRLVYEVEFESGAFEYVYIIDAVNGEILHSTRDFG